MKGNPIYTQSKPHLQDTKGIISFSSGNSHIIAVESGGDVYALGSNDSFQLGLASEKLCKNFKKI
jgi:alpha-tubulin suppressor-like RCC1 family protein